VRCAIRLDGKGRRHRRGLLDGEARALLVGGEVVLEDQLPVGDALAFRIARLRSDVGDLVGQHLSLGVAYGELLQQRPRQAPRHLGPRDGDRLSRPRRLQIVPHGDEHALGGAGGQRGQGQSGSGEHALHQ
jgi:hypothetical protein